MNYISLFSGVEAASVAWDSLGWEPVAFSEIEPFPCAVLETRFPSVPNLGDVNEIDWSGYHGTIDVVVGGSPCQAFSVAGSRRGLMDERGLLMLEFVRAVREIKPEWVLWENVPGVLSQDGGRAFATLQGELENIGYSLAWRVLDAQFFGVAQRRRRVFLVGHSRIECAAAVLFDTEGVFGDFASSREARTRLAADARRSIDGNDQECVTQNPFSFVDRCGKPGGGKGVLISDNVASTLRTAFPQSIFCVADDNAKSAIDENMSGSLKVGGGKTFIAYCEPPKYIVRRLTPVECERLQGFPDDWTNIEFKGKPASDTARCKAMGNSMAVPVMKWIGERIQAVEDITRGGDSV